MSLPLATRAFVLVAAASTTAAMITMVSEVGHPPPAGLDVLSRWTEPLQATAEALAFAVQAAAPGRQVVAVDLRD